MIVKEEILKKQKVLSISPTRKVGLDILLGAFIVVTFSGFILLYMQISSAKGVFNLNIWWWAFIHRMSALVSLIFTIPHVRKHRKWYKNYFVLKRKSKVTAILSVSFFMTLITTIILAFLRNSVLLELIHSAIGIIAVLFIIFHGLKRYHIIK